MMKMWNEMLLSLWIMWKSKKTSKRRRRSLKINCAKKGDVKEDERDEESYKMIKHTKIHLMMMSRRKMNKQKKSITKQTKKFLLFFSSPLSGFFSCFLQWMLLVCLQSFGGIMMNLIFGLMTLLYFLSITTYLLSLTIFGGVFLCERATSFVVKVTMNLKLRWK